MLQLISSRQLTDVFLRQWTWGILQNLFLFNDFVFQNIQWNSINHNNGIVPYQKSESSFLLCKKCKCINYQLHMIICKKLLQNIQKMLDKNQWPAHQF